MKVHWSNVVGTMVLGKSCFITCWPCQS